VIGPYKRRIRVFYPLQKGRIVLRTEADGEHNIEPEVVSPDRRISEFVLASDHPFLYFKPFLIVGDKSSRAGGTNDLTVLTESDSRDIYPYFTSKQQGGITPLIEVESKILSASHRMRIYVPAGYEENSLKRYPVLYMHDGKNLFFPEEAFLGSDWQVGETLDQLDVMSVIDKLIVVGVYAQNREEDYTKPGYARYARALVDEVKPWVDSNFRTLTAAEYTGVTGSSLGGVVSFYAAWQWPQVFGRVACMSSTFTHKDDLIERVLNEPKREIKIYLDSGWPNDNYEVTLSMCMALIERGYVFGLDFLYFVFPHAKHDEASWGSRCHLPLQLFNGEVVKTFRRHSDQYVAQNNRRSPKQSLESSRT
jgi:predicted alpha/beta superfamily hydrolase